MVPGPPQYNTHRWPSDFHREQNDKIFGQKRIVLRRSLVKQPEQIGYLSRMGLVLVNPCVTRHLFQATTRGKRKTEPKSGDLEEIVFSRRALKGDVRKFKGVILFDVRSPYEIFAGIEHLLNNLRVRGGLIVVKPKDCASGRHVLQDNGCQSIACPTGSYETTTRA